MPHRPPDLPRSNRRDRRPPRLLAMIETSPADRAARPTGGITVAAAQLCGTFSTSGSSWRCDPVGLLRGAGTGGLLHACQIPARYRSGASLVSGGHAAAIRDAEDSGKRDRRLSDVQPADRGRTATGDWKSGARTATCCTSSGSLCGMRTPALSPVPGGGKRCCWSSQPPSIGGHREDVDAGAVVLALFLVCGSSIRHEIPDERPGVKRFDGCAGFVQPGRARIFNDAVDERHTGPAGVALMQL